MKMEFRDGVTIQVDPQAAVTIRMLSDGILEITPRQAHAAGKRWLTSVLTVLIVAGAVSAGYLAYTPLPEGRQTSAATEIPAQQIQPGSDLTRPQVVPDSGFNVPIQRFGTSPMFGAPSRRLMVPEMGEVPQRYGPPDPSATTPQSPFGLDAP